MNLSWEQVRWRERERGRGGEEKRKERHLPFLPMLQQQQKHTIIMIAIMINRTISPPTAAATGIYIGRGVGVLVSSTEGAGSRDHHTTVT